MDIEYPYLFINNERVDTSCIPVLNPKRNHCQSNIKNEHVLEVKRTGRTLKEKECEKYGIHYHTSSQISWPYNLPSTRAL